MSPLIRLPVACALIVVLILGAQLGRLLLRYQLSRVPGELNTVTGEIVTASQNPTRSIVDATSVSRRLETWLNDSPTDARATRRSISLKHTSLAL
jgi:hypothetical protein